MTQYVLGFMFYQDDVVLILKTKGPDVVVGKWNGVGGKIEVDENPYDAMAREFKEETGYLNTDWNGYCEYHMARYDAAIYCFWNRIAPGKARPILLQMTEERVMWYGYKRLYQLKIVANLHWLIGLALDQDKPDNLKLC